MPLNVVDWPAIPQCDGSQWFVADPEQLAGLTALTFVGRAQHAADILNGAQAVPAMVPATLKANLKKRLILADNAFKAHRDGLLFETICWLVARGNAAPNDAITDPHRRATQQGADMIRVRFDPVARVLEGATIYEYKCTSYARRRFAKEVLPAFREYLEAERDDQLSQTTLALLSTFNLNQEEQAAAYEHLLVDRPLSFQAALTVTPDQFSTVKCTKLFKGFDALPVAQANRIGDTFPLANMRAWFDAFALAVWGHIDANV
jgi:hypothetical protein